MTTTAILSVGRNESPFVEEWERYHLDLGFDRLYYVGTDDDPTRAERFLRGSPLRSQIRLGRFTDFRHGWQMRCYHAYRDRIDEDWVLVIDLDEFLSLHPFSSIQEFVGTVDDGVGQPGYFDYTFLPRIEPRFERRYRYADKLASLNPEGAIRLDEYLTCRTQEEFVARLRRSLSESSPA